MNILLTGCAGFIGSHILEMLLTRGHKVFGVDNFITGKRENLKAVKQSVNEYAWKNFRFLEFDIRYNLSSAIRYGVGPEPITHICHQAALGSVPRSIENPKATFGCNVEAFQNILDLAREFKMKRVVFASSSSVYGTDQSDCKTEGRIGDPLSPYALSKRIDEMLADVYAKTYGLNYIGLRYFNVFGPRQNPDGPYAAVMPKWIKAIQSGEPIEIHGDGSTSRDFCYVKNVALANLLALESTDPKDDNQIYNIACGESTSLSDLVKIIRKETGVTNVRIRHLENRPGDVKSSLADISKAKSNLGYMPLYSVRDGLSEMLHANAVDTASVEFAPV